MPLIFSNFLSDRKIALFTLHLPCIREARISAGDGPEVDFRDQDALNSRLFRRSVSIHWFIVWFYQSLNTSSASDRTLTQLKLMLLVLKGINQGQRASFFCFISALLFKLQRKLFQCSSQSLETVDMKTLKLISSFPVFY